VDAVVLAGDVVQADNARFEAFGPLKEGIDRLTAAGIDVCAVAGNHDTEILPRLAAQIAGFHLLGEGGRWSDHVIRSGKADQVRLIGWSFPAREVHGSPFASSLPAASSDCPTLGVLHCDLDAAGSRYAPVRQVEFTAAESAAAQVAGWFLGHIHKPTLKETTPPLGYLGSLVGLDPTETGLHGPWLVEVASSGSISCRQVPLAPLRWEEITVSVAGWREPDCDLADQLTRELYTLYNQLADQLGHTRALGCRVVLEGRLEASSRLSEAVAALADPLREALVVPVQQTCLFVERIVDRHTPAVPLAELAAGQDLPALLARDLLALQQRDARGTALLEQARQELRLSVQRPEFGILPAWQADAETVRDVLLQAGWRALEQLLAQQGGGR
jgi:hypothetical protein